MATSQTSNEGGFDKGISKERDSLTLSHHPSRLRQLHPPVHSPPTPDNKAGRYLARSLALDTPPPPVPAPRARREDKESCPTESGSTSSLLPLRDLYQRTDGIGSFSYWKKPARGYGYRW